MGGLFRSLIISLLLLLGELPVIFVGCSFTFNEDYHDYPLDPNGFQTNRFITEKDLQSLKQYKQINDACIDGLLELSREIGRKHIFITSIYFPTRLFTIKEDTTGELEFNDTLFKYVSLKEYSHILLPFLHQRHYTLYYINLIENTIDYYDPYDGDPKFLQIQTLIRSWCTKVNKTIPDSSFSCSSVRSPNQHQTNDVASHSK